MRVVVAGGRSFADKEVAFKCLDTLGLTSEDVILSGHAQGADTLGEEYAKEHGIGLELYPANWAKYKKSAGFVRNVQMANAADKVVVFWNGSSHGTGNMIEEAKKRMLEVIGFDYHGNRRDDL